MKKLIIVGLSKTALHVFSFVKYHKLYDVIGFAVNREYKKETEFCGLPVFELENLKETLCDIDFEIFVAILWNHLNKDRRKVYEYCKSQGFKLANLISPLAVVRSKIEGDNCWIHDYVVIQNDAYIGSNVFAMAYSLIGAHAYVGDHCFFGARSLLGGGCTIGEQSFIGLSATVFDDTYIGRKCLIGACTSVKRNMPDFSRYVTSSDMIIKQYTENEIENKLVFSLNKR